MNNIYTRTGDRGKTSLFDNVRIGKDDARVEAYGTVDELGSYLGLAKNYFKDGDIGGEILQIQNKLFVVAAILATEDQAKIPHKILQEDIDGLEALVDKYMGQLEDPKGFIVAGSNERAGHLHVARTICRRAERRAIALSRIASIDPLVIKYINRLSDAIYAMARYSEDQELAVDYNKNK